MENILTGAFWELLEEKPYKKITVKDIVDRCKVNRNTFYYHFDGINSLFEEALIAWEEKIFRDPRTIAHPLTCVLPIAEDLMARKAGVEHLLESKVRDTFFGELSVIAHRAADMYVTIAEQSAGGMAVPESNRDRSPGQSTGQSTGQSAGQSAGGMSVPENKQDRSTETENAAEQEREHRPERGPERERKLRMYFFRKTYNASDRAILVRFYRSALEGFITSWIMDGMNSDLTYEVERLLELLKR